MGIKNINWTPTGVMYSMEILCAMKRITDQSYLSSFAVFGFKVINFDFLINRYVKPYNINLQIMTNLTDLDQFILLCHNQDVSIELPNQQNSNIGLFLYHAVRVPNGPRSI